jgi:hypothetical protein
VSRPALDRRRSRPGDRDQLRPAVRGDVVQ